MRNAMNKVFENIARENFRSSGYITHPGRERRVRWSFSTAPRSPFFAGDLVRDALERRERALSRQKRKTSFLVNCLNVFFNR
jgi:hypothetical protein